MPVLHTADMVLVESENFDAEGLNAGFLEIYYPGEGASMFVYENVVAGKMQVCQSECEFQEPSVSESHCALGAV